MADRSVEEPFRGGKVQWPEASATDTIHVAPDAPGGSRGILRFGDRTFSCALGRNGVVSSKVEGDGATPAGTWPLRRVLWRADRLPRPVTLLPTAAIAPADGWCDAPASPAYNRPIRHPFGDSAERLWREDSLYDVIVVLGYNDRPVRPGAGSAIFMHVARPDHAPTEGCIALALPDLLDVLAGLRRAAVVQITAEPAST